MAEYPSTNLPQTNNPQDIQKSALDLLDKVNQTHAAALSAASDAQEAAQAASDPASHSSAGVGQFLEMYPGVGVAFILPAGGTWIYWGILINGTTGVWIGGGHTGGVAAGGTTVGALSAGNVWMGWAKRIT